MTAIQDKLIDLKGLNVPIEDIYRTLRFKLMRPLTKGTAGQVLALKDADDENTEWKDLPAIPTTNDIRRIVNEQLAKTKFTINDQGHLIIETPEA